MGAPVATLALLDGSHLADALRAGIYRLFSRTEHLNRINVFPVPDGDTGTNLSMTLRAVLTALDREPTSHAGKLLTCAADAAIDGARGNSGAILAQFLLGVGDRAGPLEKLTPAHFAATIDGGADATHRFCTECIVTGSSIEHRRLREQLSACGSSLIVAGTHRKARIHIHTNDPENVFRVADGYGAVSAQKADDMIRLTAAAHHARNRRVAVVTDSAADIPDDELARLQIHMVPLRVHFGARRFPPALRVPGHALRVCGCHQHHREGERHHQRGAQCGGSNGARPRHRGRQRQCVARPGIDRHVCGRVPR